MGRALRVGETNAEANKLTIIISRILEASKIIIGDIPNAQPGCCARVSIVELCNALADLAGSNLKEKGDFEFKSSPDFKTILAWLRQCHENQSLESGLNAVRHGLQFAGGAPEAANLLKYAQAHVSSLTPLTIGLGTGELGSGLGADGSAAADVGGDENDCTRTKAYLQLVKVVMTSKAVEVKAFGEFVRALCLAESQPRIDDLPTLILLGLSVRTTHIQLCPQVGLYLWGHIRPYLSSKNNIDVECEKIAPKGHVLLLLLRHFVQTEPCAAGRTGTISILEAQTAAFGTHGHSKKARCFEQMPDVARLDLIQKLTLVIEVLGACKVANYCAEVLAVHSPHFKEAEAKYIAQKIIDRHLIDAPAVKLASKILEVCHHLLGRVELRKLRSLKAAGCHEHLPAPQPRRRGVRDTGGIDHHHPRLCDYG